MPTKPANYVLSALLYACRVQGYADIGNEKVEGLVNLRVDVLLSDIYVSANKYIERARKGLVEW